MVESFSWFGIDFGTTNSAAFSFTGTDKDHANPISYGDDEGRPFPSVVAIDKETGEVITGRAAKDQRNSIIRTHQYFSSIKSLIDSEKKEIIAGKEWSAEDIAAEIFKSLKERMERGSKNIVKDAVVAVPVGYTARKKGHLRHAAAKAGINIKMFITEPTAAFCSNYLELKSCRNVVVFDWGGGTLDVAVLRIESGKVYELATEGMPVAGNDIDKKLAEKMHAKFMRGKSPVISIEELGAREPETMDLLMMKCEQAKCAFSDEDVAVISLYKYGSYGSVRESVDYDFFALLLEPIINDAIGCLDRAIQNAGMNIANIDRILCVGGSSQLRPLREKLSERYGEELIYYPKSVMWNIAEGAAINSTQPGNYTVSKPIGMILSDGSFFPLIKSGQCIPCEEFHMTLGTVEGSEDDVKEARFIFTDAEVAEDRSFEENFILPMRGFSDEVIMLSCYIDQDFIFKLKVGSNRMVEDAYRVWSYDKLKICYQIEGK